jgi:hypothetical protein
LRKIRRFHGVILALYQAKDAVKILLQPAWFHLNIVWTHGRVEGCSLRA